MSVKYVEPGTVEMNTVRLLAHFAQVGTWSVDHYVGEGFTLISAVISASGPLPGEPSTMVRKWTDIHKFKQRDGKFGNIDLSWKYRAQHLMEHVTVNANNADKVMALMQKKYPHITFQMEYVTIMDEDRNVIFLRARGKAQKRRLYVLSVNGIEHASMDTEVILGLVHNMAEGTCAIQPGSHTNATICMLAKEE